MEGMDDGFDDETDAAQGEEAVRGLGGGEAGGGAVGGMRRGISPGPQP
jgi:hypothetical protein